MSYNPKQCSQIVESLTKLASLVSNAVPVNIKPTGTEFFLQFSPDGNTPVEVRKVVLALNDLVPGGVHSSLESGATPIIVFSPFIMSRPLGYEVLKGRLDMAITALRYGALPPHTAEIEERLERLMRQAGACLNQHIPYKGIKIKTEDGVVFRATFPDPIRHVNRASLINAVDEALRECGAESRANFDHDEIIFIATRDRLKTLNSLDKAVQYIKDEKTLASRHQADWDQNAWKDSVQAPQGSKAFVQNYLLCLFGNQAVVNFHPADGTKPAFIFVKADPNSPDVDSGLERLRGFMPGDQIDLQEKGIKLHIPPELLRTQIALHDDAYIRATEELSRSITR